jgi:hypothetical protein
MLTVVTAGALGFLGALLGVLGGHVGMIGWLRSNPLNGGIAALGAVPSGDLLFLSWLCLRSPPSSVGCPPGANQR